MPPEKTFSDLYAESLNKPIADSADSLVNPIPFRRDSKIERILDMFRSRNQEKRANASS
jgi:hypothetical protein